MTVIIGGWCSRGVLTQILEVRRTCVRLVEDDPEVGVVVVVGDLLKISTTRLLTVFACSDSLSLNFYFTELCVKCGKIDL